jgi:hypothetical protein
MKTIRILSHLVIVLLCSKSLSAQTEQMTVSLSNPGKPFSLNAEVLSGSIKVSSHQGNEILIEATPVDIENEEEVNDSGEGMKRISNAKGFEISANENDNSVTIRNNSLIRRVDLSLKIPQQQVNLKLSTVNAGDIETDNIKGELEINNVTGSIKLTNISGSVVASTISGDLTVKFVSVDPDAAMAFSTLTGKIDVTLPPDIKTNLKLKSEMGDVFSDFDISIDKSQPVVNRVEKAGMYQLQVEDWIYGKINGGGPEFMMKSMQGNIYIRKTK